MGTKISSMLLVIMLDDINVSLRDASSSIWDGIRFLVQSFKPALDLLLSHNELLLPAIILLYFVIRSSRMIFLYFLQLIEFSVRLLRFIRNLISELFWINPRYRLKRAKRYESQANFSLLAIFLRFVEEIFSLPIDWFCSLGIKGVFAPDPFTESKNYTKTAFFPSLRERLSIVGNNHITIYFFLSLLRLFVHRLFVCFVLFVICECSALCMWESVLCSFQQPSQFCGAHSESEQTTAKKARDRQHCE